jgi:hypothetical protein
MKDNLMIFRYIFLFLFCISTVVLGGCSLVPTWPPFPGSSPPAQSQGGSSQDSGKPSSPQESSSQDKPPKKKIYKIVVKKHASTDRNGGISFWDKLKLKGLNLGLNPLGWIANIDEHTGSFKAASQFQSLPIEILFNTGGGKIVEFAGLKLADIEIPLSKEGVMPALDNNIVRLLQQKGVSEQTARSLSTWLQPVLSAIRKAF